MMNFSMWMMFKFTSNVFSFRRRSWLSVFLKIFALYSLQCTANVLDLKNKWDIQGPEAKICGATVCDNSSSVIRLDYTIHKNAQFPKSRIFQKGCKEEFEAGTEPVLGGVSPDEDNRIDLTKSAASDGLDTVTASLDIRLTEDSLKSSWWQKFAYSENQQKTVEFCIRMGLWLPPQAGKVEVNFRETNIAVILDKKESSSDRDGYAVSSVVLDPIELVSIEVNLMGSASGIEDSTVGVDKDEL
uniref:Uncharacterized protein n=1 Tax=Pseudo-nitzschia delicatissima TaxID=44447 RepID=A0A7S0XK33_9STRA|mmetsp:Transcript_1624/g.3784  ORF Transcript_1624/g.3784 Transcript_1624/m.3784 type:complete len:243 (+) Transcript_1624:144-872(+)